MAEAGDYVWVSITAVAPLDRMEECSVSLKADTRKMTVVGNIPELGGWSLVRGVSLLQEKADESEVVWTSQPIKVSRKRLPFKYKFVANGHRNSPTTRPLIWDRLSRTSKAPAKDSSNLYIVDRLQFTAFNSDSGWITSSGVGAYQLRVGQPPGSKEPLIMLEEGEMEPFKVQLFEAKAGDPKVPQGKAFAALSTFHLGLKESPSLSLLGSDAPVVDEGNVTYLMNAPSIEALAFRVDVLAETDDTLLARAYVSHHTLKSLQGTISASLVTPELKQVGLFRAEFLVATSLDLDCNNLTDLQRSRWSPEAAAARGTLDIGHRGAGASIGRDGSQRSVRENTMLSFQKAAVNHSDFIEFDVHVTGDAEVVVHHDFDVKLNVGDQLIHLGIPVLTYAQLSSTDFTHAMVGLPHAPFLENQQRLNKRIMKRNNSSAEEMVRRLTKPELGRGNSFEKLIGPWRIADKIATLREAFRDTPEWLGFNIELKYPSEAQLAAMTYRFYDRNYFVDSILKVVLQEAGSRKVIFSTFDPDCATLLSLKQPRFPVFFLTCAGAKQFADPRMNSLEAAFFFAKSSNLQGVVAESTLLLDRLQKVTQEFHAQGLYLFTWGEANNNWENYAAQKSYGLDGIILDDVARVTKACGKRSALFNRPIQSPASQEDLGFGEQNELRSPNALQKPEIDFAEISAKVAPADVATFSEISAKQSGRLQSIQEGVVSS